MILASRRHRLGFTLVELLVVIVIIGLLAAISLVVYSNAQRTARDTKRRADIVTLQTELEKYYTKNGAYPSSVSTISGPLILTTDKILPTSTLAQLKTLLPSLQDDFGDPADQGQAVFTSPQSEAKPTYLYIGGLSYNKGGGSSASGTLTQTITFKDGSKQVCDFTYSFTAATPDDQTTSSYVLGYYSEAQKKYIFVHGQKGVIYPIATNALSSKPCAYSATPV